jgi:hypothetical protein
MTDRTVTVRLEADISDFVSGIGVQAVAAVKRLEAAASKVDTSLKKTTTTAKNDIEQLGSKADTTSEKISKIGASASKTGATVKASATQATQATEKLTESVTKSTKATAENSKTVTVASKNADAHANALGRLRTAQLRLAEVQSRKGSAGTSGLAGAEEAVASAERAVKKFEKPGEDSGRSFGSGFKKWLTGSGDGLFSELGKSGGSVFGSGFLGALKTPILGPAIIAVLSAAFVTAMPAIGAVAGGALVTAFGAGLAGLGILFAAKSNMVGATWSEMMGRLGRDMQLLAKPFEGTLVNIAGFFQRTVDAFNPALSKAFASMAGPVQNFTDTLLSGFERLIPAIGPITAAFNGILSGLGPGLSSMIGDLAAGMTELSVSISRNPAALGDFVAGIGMLIESTLKFITTLNDINSGFSTLTGGVSLVTVVMAGLAAAVDTVAAPFRLLNGAIAGTNALLGKTGGDVAGAGKSMSDAAINTVALANGTAGVGAAAQHAGPYVMSMAEKIQAAKKAAAEAKAKYDAWIDSIFRLQNLALGLSGAQINLQKAFDDASKSVKDNGRNLDINTEKGQANRLSLNAVAAAANDQTEKMLNSGKGIRAASNAATASQAGFIALAQRMGLSKAAAAALARQLIAVPKKTQTDFKADITDLNAKIATAKAKLRDPNLSATKRAKLEAEIKQLLAAKAQAQASINSLTGKTVALTTNVYRNMIETTVHKDIGVRPLPAKADGGYHPQGYPSYADGKLPDQAMVAPGKGGGLVQWAEQETGGEAFIPLAPSKRDRSTKILGQVAGNFGLGLVKSFADGGFLPGGRLVDIAYLLRQLGIPFNPSAGVNYGSTLAAQNKANLATIPALQNLNRKNVAESAAKADVARLQREITLQQREIAKARAVPASKSKDKDVKAGAQAAKDKKVKQEQAELIKLQDKLYVAKGKQKTASDAQNKAEDAYKLKVDAAKKATDAHKDAIEKLVAQQKAAVEMAGQIADALTSNANIGDLFGQSLTGKGLLADLQGKGTDLAAFRGQIDKLRKQGLSEDLITQIIGKGAEQGGDVAQAILDGGLGLVAALNKAQKALDDQANLIGAGSATKQYGQTIAGARAKGGPTAAQQSYLVGEDGPEILRMGRDPGWVQPNQYVGSTARSTTTVIHEHRHYQKNQFYGVSMAEADLIAQRANQKAELMAKGY